MSENLQGGVEGLEMKRLYLLLAGLTVFTMAFTRTVPAAGWKDGDHFVATNGGHAGSYTNWVDAATNIQAAVDASIAGDAVWVSNGVYITATPVLTPSSLHAGYTNVSCVYLAKNITLKSVNGPNVTVIDGNYNVITARCVLISYGATLDGFTVRNGRSYANQPYGDSYGGGILIYDGIPDGNTYGGIVTNCIVRNNYGNAGGIMVRIATGTVANCTIYSNTASNGGGGVSVDAVYKSGSKIENCTIFDNNASTDMGGGIRCSDSYLTFRNCLVYRNTAATFGGGVYVRSTAASYIVNLDNCTIVSNYAAKIGGGLFVSNSPAANVCNSIIYYNVCSLNADVFTLQPTLTNNCMSDITALTAGLGNITNAPLFVDTNSANYRLSVNSPCLNTGTNRGWMDGAVDLDGRKRKCYGTVDMGAYETIYDGSIFQAH